MTTDTDREPPLFADQDIASVRPDASPTTKPAATRKIATGKPATAPRQRRDAGATAIVVAASAVALHPALGIDAAEFAASHTALIDELAEDLRRGATTGERPTVILDGGRYLALDHVEVAVAAGLAVAHAPDLALPVLVADGLDQARLVRGQLASGRGKSGWEQYSALAAIFVGGSVRDVLRALDLKLGWESTVSRVLKVGRLDPAVLEAVDRFTIPVKEAGQLVDAWQDANRREAMTAALAALRAGSNRPLDARACIRALLTVGRPELVDPAWVDGEDGRRDYVAADGTVLASATVADGRWTSEGIAMAAAQWQAFVKSMPRPGDGRATCSRASSPTCSA